MAKSKKETSPKKKTDPKELSESAKIMMEAIEESKKGSACEIHNDPSCSVDSVKLGDKPHEDLGLSKDDMMRALRIMITARTTDNKHLT
ncbi:MAG: hypothetical protein ACOCX7_02010, partial [Bacteroidota bacterium]